MRGSAAVCCGVRAWRGDPLHATDTAYAQTPCGQGVCSPTPPSSLTVAPRPAWWRYRRGGDGDIHIVEPRACWAGRGCWIDAARMCAIGVWPLWPRLRPRVAMDPHQGATHGARTARRGLTPSSDARMGAGASTREARRRAHAPRVLGTCGLDGHGRATCGTPGASRTMSRARRHAAAIRTPLVYGWTCNAQQQLI